MAQMKVKTQGTFPYLYSVTDMFGNTLIKRSPNLGTEGLAFDQYVDTSGNTWVRVAGTAAVGGVSTSGLLVPMRVDEFGNVGVALPNAATGAAPLNSTSTAYEASRLVKPTSGVLMGMSGYNSKGSAQFVLIVDYSGAILPANTTVPVVVISVAAASNFSYDPGKYGRQFSAGIWVVNSSTPQTVTIGSADCWIDAQYI